MNLKSIDIEEEFIKHIEKFTHGVGDDCAFVSDMAISKDLLIEDVHFRTKYFTPEEIGWKAMTATVSDLYACAATPFYFLVGLGLPEWVDKEYIGKIYTGFSRILRLSGGKIVGGDIVSSEKLLVSITGIGLCTHPLKRKEKISTKWNIYVSGPTGDASAGLFLLEKESYSPDKENCQNEWKLPRRIYTYLTGRLKKPIPRKFHFSAMKRLIEKGYQIIGMDLSDDLARSLWILSRENKASIKLEEVPLSKPLLEFSKVTGEDPARHALYGGEDFELLIALPEGTETEELKIFKKIGYMEPSREPKVIYNNRVLERKGWKHF